MSNWPKKQSIKQYLERWYCDGACSANTIKNQLKNGDLPGEKDPGGTWYIWVGADGRPDWSYYRPEATKTPIKKQTGTGNDLADSILKKHKLSAVS